MNHLWVLGIMLLAVAALAFLGFFKSREGFQSANTVNPASQLIRCPTGYKFFNSPNGDSMCCKGAINPYTHTCDAVATDGICAFSEVPDRRLGRTGNYPLCSTLIATEMTSSASQFCPTSLPHYAKESDDAAKCCKNPVQMAGTTGFKCSAEDLKDTAQYCIVKGTPVRNTTDDKDEKMCDEAVMIDTTSCPTVGGVTLQKVDYVMGTREATKYANNSLVGRTIPACFGIDKTCIPTSSIQYAQKLGAFTDYDPAKWEYSCEVLGKTAGGAMVQGMQRGYLGTPGTYTTPR